ncbi:MAG: hypothetical protein DWQ54_25610 [Microcystis flos-aquae TF09]|uniref:Uncharacterized protein n=2 Tax=Microcystis TaxID=1125 RepID=A0A3E0KTX4_9CHRO|nr:MULTISPECIES: hypothetical protein [Microcystis]KXS88930.1 hypothetical protein OA58_24125 [Microcystis aeruginosa NIES-88]MCA2718596.1 hypothetical protein [Microcystis sp. M169S2]REJ38566.1 MAG: hypothetical protein DWQ54_25610 [Microcystis flos-aquae TF09]BCU13543.1 hypothetical protein MAN88_41070 [Microcystis aeruginosa]
MGRYIIPYLSLAIMGTLMLCPLGSRNSFLPQKAIAQTRQQANTNRSAWQVALPQQATVRRKKGSSLTGKLVKFDPKTLTVTAGGDSENISLTEVKSVEFTLQDEIWVTLPNGARGKVRPIRGLTIPIENVPASSFKIGRTNDSVILNLTQVLNDQEFGKLTSDPNKIYVLKTIEMTSPNKMTIYLRAYGSQV